MSNNSFLAALALASTASFASASIPTDLIPNSQGAGNFGVFETADTRTKDNRDERQDDRQDCRQAEGAGKDKRDCKQDGRQSG